MVCDVCHSIFLWTWNYTIYIFRDITGGWGVGGGGGGGGVGWISCIGVLCIYLIILFQDRNHQYVIIMSSESSMLTSLLQSGIDGQ